MTYIRAGSCVRTCSSIRIYVWPDAYIRVDLCHRMCSPMRTYTLYKQGDVSKCGQCCRFVRRGRVRLPEDTKQTVFGRASLAPTADDGIGRFSFGTLPCCKKTLMFSKKMVMFLKNITIFFKKPGMFLCKGRWNHPHQVGHSFFSVHPYILAKIH